MNGSRATPPPSAEVLVARVAVRDAEAFAMLYDRYVPAVYGLTRRMLGTADAEDAVQEIFLILWRNAAQFDGARGSFTAWFMTIARHHVVHVLRLRGRSAQIAAAEEAERALLEHADPSPSTELLAQQHEDAARLRAALRALPSDQRRALALAYFGGLSQSEIAEHTGWPLGTVKKRIALGMQKLRGALVEETFFAAAVEAIAPPPVSS